LFFSYNHAVNKTALIAILTDFGAVDPFSGIMKGVISTIAPQATILEISNQIPPGDIKRAAINLWQSRPYFPPGTIFLAVVDPGVGTSRKAILMQSGGHTYVGPDNGLFTFVMEEDARVWNISNPAYTLAEPGSTFHGRDIFAPAAAHAALDVPGPEFGPPVSEPVRISLPQLELQGPGELSGEILYADRFGNLLTSLGRFERAAEGWLVLNPWLPPLQDVAARLRFRPEELTLEIEDDHRLHWVNTFAEISPGDCAFLVGSSGLIEIASNRQSAAEKLNLASADRVILRTKGEPHG
jgi:S-adenosylmethionine hydrolase